MQSIIKVSNLIVDVLKKDIKNIHLNVLPPYGEIRVSAPLKTNDEAIRLFIVSKLSWIKKQRDKFEKQERETRRKYISGENHYFRGQRYLLNIIDYKGNPKVILRNTKYMDFYINKSSSVARKKRIMNNWYRRELKKILPSLIKKWNKKMKMDIQDYRVKYMKTKWGSCNEKDERIWINLELIKKPLHHLEYVVVHEMTHFLERKHNDRFVGYMNKFMPQWRMIKGELNNFILCHEDWGE